MRAQKLVAQITMTVLDVDEVKAKLGGYSRGALKIGNDAADLAIRQHWIVLINRNAPIEKRVMVKDSWFGFRLLIRSTKAAGMSELQANQETVG